MWCLYEFKRWARTIINDIKGRRIQQDIQRIKMHYNVTKQIRHKFQLSPSPHRVWWKNKICVILERMWNVAIWICWLIPLEWHSCWPPGRTAWVVSKRAAREVELPPWCREGHNNSLIILMDALIKIGAHY